jgi:hypothetical protein
MTVTKRRRTRSTSISEPQLIVTAANDASDPASSHGVSHRFRRFLHHFTANEHAHDAERLQKDSAAIGATPIKRCAAGSRTSVAGTIRSITLQPVTGTPALHADLWDGTGSLRVVWLGRRQIPGIDPGRELLVEGRVVEEHGHPTMYNPRYELRNGQEGPAH